MKWHTDTGEPTLVTVEAPDRDAARSAWRNLPGRKWDDVLLSVTNDWQAIETARQTGELPPAATDPEDRKRMLGGSQGVANALFVTASQLPTWKSTLPTVHDTFVSFMMTGPDAAEYTVTVVLTKPAPKPLPTEPGAMIFWSVDGRRNIAELNNSGVWVKLTGGTGRDTSTAAAMEHFLVDTEWHELEVKA